MDHGEDDWHVTLSGSHKQHPAEREMTASKQKETEFYIAFKNSVYIHPIVKVQEFERFGNLEHYLVAPNNPPFRAPRHEAATSTGITGAKLNRARVAKVCKKK